MTRGGGVTATSTTWRGIDASRSEKLTLAFFGIRGVGSFYYLAFGLNRMETPEAQRLWAIVGLAVLVSILLHGLTVTPVMRLLDRNRGIDPDTGEIADPEMPELPFEEPPKTV